MTHSAEELLAAANVEVASETYAIVSIDRDQWQALLQDPSASPRMESPFMILMDTHEVTLMLDDTDLSKMRRLLGGARIETGYRLLTFNIELGFDVVGFLAKITAILASAGIPVIALSAFSRDHILVRQNDLANALKALGPHVRELC